MKNLSSSVVIVTGGASGIGLSIVQILLNRKAKVAVVDRDRKALDRLESREGLLKFALDVSIPEQAKEMVMATEKEWGAVKCAVNAAGVLGPYAPVEEVEDSAWAELIRSNLDSVFYSMKYEIQSMKKGGGGSIVNISSALGIVGMANAAAYVASKHGIIGLSKAAALELAQQKVRVNVIAPGAVDTPLFRATTGSTKEGYEAIRNMHPMKRVASSDEIAASIVYLLSDEASFITGTVLPVDGGWTVW